MASLNPQGGVCWDWNVRVGSAVSPSTAAQGFSPGLSADGSLIYSRGGPLRKQLAPVEDSSCFTHFSKILILNQEHYLVEELTRQVHDTITTKNFLNMDFVLLFYMIDNNA